MIKDMATIFLILFALFFICLAWKNLVWATAFIIAFLPAYLIRFKIRFLPMTILELMILILFIVWLTRGKNKKLSTFKYPIFAWLIAAAISVLVSPDLRSALGIWKAYFIEPILFFLVFVNIIKAKKDLNLIFTALGFSALYISLFALWQKIAGQGAESLISWSGQKVLRATSVFEYPNAAGLYLAPVILLLTGWASAVKKKKILLYCCIVVLLSFLAIIFAKSEGAFLGILAGLLFAGMTIKDARKFTLAGLTVFIILILFFAPLKNYLWQKATFSDFSGQIRKEMWGETWQMLKQKPLFGAGLSGYQKAAAPYHKKSYIEIYLYPHSIFLNFWSELGLLGLFVFFWIIAKFFKSGFSNFAIKQPNNLTIFVLAAMIALLTHGLFDVPYFKNDLSVLFWLIIGLMEINNYAHLSH